ncbi:MAG: ATP-dependent helicase [Acidimicrobiaceae bacterium]|nr:ATP-dependent helicase [Acidimicrobiaceae bacterium]
MTARLTNGLGATFVDRVYEARLYRERWGAALLRLHAAGYPDFPAGQAARARRTVDLIQERLATLDDDLEAWIFVNPGIALSEWLRGEATMPWIAALGLDALSDEAHRLLSLVGDPSIADLKLGPFLNVMETRGKDLAGAEPGGIRLKTIASSKGLTVNTTILVGLEEELMPHSAHNARLDEERRLLYVALTRARELCIATMATRRSGVAARSGSGSVVNSRHRSSLVQLLSFGTPKSGDSFIRAL